MYKWPYLVDMSGQHIFHYVFISSVLNAYNLQRTDDLWKKKNQQPQTVETQYWFGS